MRLTILLNPAANRGKSRRALARALEVLRGAGVKPQIRESRNARHLTELARAACTEMPDVVVSAGGDGTHHYVLNGLLGSKIPLGFLSLGSGNDLARGLGVPIEPCAAARTLLQGRVRAIDVARVGPVAYGGVAGVGFDSVVNRYVNDHVRHIRGSMAYAWGILRCLGPFVPQPLEIRSDAENFSGEVMFAVVGNNVAYGGGLRITPRARLDDGLLDVCVVPAMGKFELLRWVPRSYSGGHLAHPRIKYFQARKISLRSPSRLELFGDGEFLQELPATVEAMPSALRVIAPGQGQ